MEAIGLTIGVVGLAGLYSICLQAMKQIDIGTNIGKDSQTFILMLQVEMYLLEKWGEKTGMNVDGSLREGSGHEYPILRTDRGRLLIFGVLANIERTLSDKDNLSKKYGLESARRLPSSINPTLAGTINKTQHAATTVQTENSLSRKFVWAIRDKRKFEVLVADLGVFIEKLYSLTAPEDNGEGISDVIGALDKLQQFVEGIAKEMREGLVAQRQFQNEATEYFDQTKRENLLAWVGPILTEEDYDEARRERQRGTCLWIFQTDAFIALRTGASMSNVLWIHGGPGTGKTFLSACIVEFLKQRSSLPVAYFFCKNEDVDKNNTVSILRSWICQLANQRIEALNVLETLKGSHAKATEANLWNIFPQILDRLRCCYLVVDGCDELADHNPAARHRRSGVIKIFFEKILQSTTSSTTKLIVISRDDPTIRSGLTQNGHDLQEYAISPDDTAHDIKLFARETIKPIDIHDKAIEGQFVEQLSRSCQGMFLWVRLEGERLEKGMDPRELQKILSSMPRGLGHSYQRNLRRILGLDEEMKNRALNILRWVLFATRPLSVVELFHLLAVNENGASEPSEVPTLITDDLIRLKVLRVCGSLVEAQGGVHPAYKKIHFLHFSAKEFLLSRQNQIDHPDLEEFFYPAPELNHGIIASSCLSFLLADTQPQAVTSAVDYPRDMWREHLRLSSADYKDVCRDLQIKLFSPGLAFNRWIRSQTEDNWSGLTPLDAACWFGLSDILQALLAKRQEYVNQPECIYGNTLHIATLTGNNVLVHHLLSMGVFNVNSTNKCGWTPLHIASSSGYEAIVEYLLTRRSINVNAVDEYGETPLHAAVNNAQIGVVALLLTRSEININVPNRWGSTPLSVAVRGGGGMSENFLVMGGTYKNSTSTCVRIAQFGNSNRLEIPVAEGVLVSGSVRIHPMSYLEQSREFERAQMAMVEQLLSRQDIDVNLCDRRGQAALFIAAENGYGEIVQCLLAREDLNRGATEAGGLTPLLTAAVRGVMRPIKRLFARTNVDVADERSVLSRDSSTIRCVHPGKSAGINSTDHQGRTSLHTAAWNGHVFVVECLLALPDIDVNATDNEQWTPLYAAARNGHPSVVERLLSQKDIDVNFPNSDQCTPLFAAATGGHAAVVEHLSALPQTDVNATNIDSWTPLYAAATAGYTSVVEQLLGRQDVDVNFLSGDRRTPLFAAASGGHAAVVERLITLPHTNVNAPGGKGRSPLYAAVKGGHTAVVEQLLSRQDVDINAACSNGAPPIFMALYHEHETIAERLLRRPDINVHYSNRYGQTLLHTAVTSGCEKAVSILIARTDVNINAQSTGGSTPLFSAARRGRRAVVEVLLAREDIDINRPDDEGCTPIVIAARRRNNTIVETMLSKNGIDVSAADANGLTLLHIAAIAGLSDIIQRLISSHDVDINAVTVDGWTPIYLAASAQHEDIVRTLLARTGIQLDWSGEDVPETRRHRFTREDQQNATRFLQRLRLETNVARLKTVKD